MSWNRTCGVSTTSSSTGSTSSSASLTRDYEPPPAPASSFFFFSSSDEPSTRGREEINSLPPPPPAPPVFSSRHHVSDTCLCNPSYDISSSFQSPFVYEQYLTSFKSEQSEHLPYLFDNIIYPQPCSPPSPTNDAITYYQLDQANTTTIVNKFPPRSHMHTIQPITYQQLSLIEPPSSNIQQKLPIVKRFYYDSTMSNTTTTTIITTTPLITNTNNDQAHLPYARLDSIFFGTFDIWHERTLVGRKNNRREVDVNMGSTPVVSRIHFELLLSNGMEFHLKCLSKNGMFINNNYAKMASTTVLPKQCTLRFPSTDLCISFSSLLINQKLPEPISRHISTETSQRRLSSPSIPMDITSSGSFQSVPNPPSQQQVIFTQMKLKQEMENHLPPLSINIPHSSSSVCSTASSYSDGSTNEQMKSQHQSPTNYLGTSALKTEPNENQITDNSPKIPSNGNDTLPQESDSSHLKNGRKPPFSYAQLIVQAIQSAADKQMTLSQIYNFISAQYPYYEANNRGWQNSIRHNLSLNRYFIRLARKDNESGKGSFWRLDQTCEDKLIDHAFRHRKQRTNSHNHLTIAKIESEDLHSPTAQYNDFLLADNSCTPLSSMTSPLIDGHSPNDCKRKRHDDEEEIEDLLNDLLNAIDQTSKRRKR